MYVLYSGECWQITEAVCKNAKARHLKSSKTGICGVGVDINIHNPKQCENAAFPNKTLCCISHFLDIK